MSDLAVNPNLVQEQLEFPDTRKTTRSGNDARFAYALTEMQGWRDNMEDAHVAELSLDGPSRDPPNAFFAVYDGHCGDSVALFAANRLHPCLRDLDSYQQGQYTDALKTAFLKTDEAIFQELVPPTGSMSDDEIIFTKGMLHGSCAISALFTSDDRLFITNLGDSRAVISCKGVAEALSIDAKPNNREETVRVRKAGGVVLGGRILGSLAVSRALGDFAIKSINEGLSRKPEERMVSSMPEVHERQITRDDEFLVVACDGIWDVLSSQQTIDAIRVYISQGKTLPEVSEAVCELCLAPDLSDGPCGTDNTTIIVIAILHGRTVEEWYKDIADSVRRSDPAVVLPAPFSESRLAVFREKRAKREA